MTKTILILLLAILPPSLASAQQSEYKKTNFLFDHDIHETKKGSVHTFFSAIDPNKIERIELIGHTDSDGSEKYNYSLAHRRCKSVRKQLLELGIKKEKIVEEALGEDQPIASNEIESGKATNRRVECKIYFKEEPILEILAGLSLIDFKKEKDRFIETQEFKVSNNSATEFTSKDGTIFKFEAGSFQTTRCAIITLKLKEYNSKSRMIFGNVHTMSNNEALESAAMYDLRAYCEGKEIQLKRGKNYEVLVPLESGKELREDMKLFYGEKDFAGNLNWIESIDPNSMRLTYYWGGGVDARLGFLYRAWRFITHPRQTIEYKKNRDRVKKTMDKAFSGDRMFGSPTRESGGINQTGLYQFYPDKMGLINCDYFIPSEPELLAKHQFKINSELNSTSELHFILLDKNAVLKSGYLINQSDYTQTLDTSIPTAVLLLNVLDDKRKTVQYDLQIVNWNSETDLNAAPLEDLDSLTKEIDALSNSYAKNETSRP